MRDMLAALEHATIAGRNHLMRKVVAVLDLEASSSGPRLSEAQQRAIAGAMDALAREAARLAPDGGAFARNATEIVDTLAGVA